MRFDNRRISAQTIHKLEGKRKFQLLKKHYLEVCDNKLKKKTPAQFSKILSTTHIIIW